MKKVHWRPKAVSRTALMLIATFAMVGLIMVEQFPVVTQRPHQVEKRAAAQKAAEAFEEIFYARQATGVPYDLQADPTGSGLLGLPMSSVTSLAGTLEDKQSTINPNFAAVIVQFLKDAGVRKGDVVAVGVSGSFPALNVCTYAALETLDLKPIVISSASSSQWGANIPDLLWVDMERGLNEDGIFETRSVAASIGGHADRGLRFPKEGLDAITEALKRNDLPLINNKKFEKNVDDRMELYQKQSGGKPIKCYLNVGGGMVSVGRTAGKRSFKSGVNLSLPAEAKDLDGVMPRFAKRGIPVIHVVKVSEMAEEFGMPMSPVTMPKVGESEVFERAEYNRWLAGGVLLLEIAMLFAFIRSDIGSRLLRNSGKPKSESAPEAMV